MTAQKVMDAATLLLVVSMIVFVALAILTPLAHYGVR